MTNTFHAGHIMFQVTPIGFLFRSPLAALRVKRNRNDSVGGGNRKEAASRSKNNFQNRSLLRLAASFPSVTPADCHAERSEASYDAVCQTHKMLSLAILIHSFHTPVLMTNTFHAGHMMFQVTPIGFLFRSPLAALRVKRNRNDSVGGGKPERSGEPQQK
jgi:hypothetical protein